MIKLRTTLLNVVGFKMEVGQILWIINSYGELYLELRVFEIISFSILFAFFYSSKYIPIDSIAHRRFIVQ